jgi:hypothetical protein
VRLKHFFKKEAMQNPMDVFLVQINSFNLHLVYNISMLGAEKLILNDETKNGGAGGGGHAI